MDTIFMNSENSRTSEYHVLVLKLTDKLDLRRGQKTVALSNLSIYYTWKNIKSSYNNNKFKISAPTWNEEFAFKITKNKNGENVPHLEVAELVLVHCNLVNNDYQQDSRILYTFVPNKTFGSLLEISPTNHVFLKTVNSEFQEIKMWFADKKSKPLEVEDRINVTLIIK